MRGRLLLALSASLLLTVPAFAQKNYIALGDSYAWGYLNSATPASNGDQGYVKPFDDYLATVNGGVRPTLNNLAIPGESSSSFFTGTSAVINASPLIVDAPVRNQPKNTNYPGATTSQLSLFNSTANAIITGGQKVDYVTVQFGGNDFIGPLIQPNFQALAPLQQQALLAAQLSTLQTNYVNLLTAVRAKAPNAVILALGYPDPLAGLGGANPFPGSTALTIQENAVIQAVATAFGAKYIDIFTPFVGNELAYTSVGTLDGGFPNIHPTPLGYQVIANQLITAVSPEPSAIALLLPAFGGLFLLRRRAR